MIVHSSPAKLGLPAPVTLLLIKARPWICLHMLLATSPVPVLKVCGLMQQLCSLQLCSLQLCLRVDNPMELPFPSHALGMCPPPFRSAWTPVAPSVAEGDGRPQDALAGPQHILHDRQVLVHVAAHVGIQLSGCQQAGHGLQHSQGPVVGRCQVVQLMRLQHILQGVIRTV